MTTTTTTTTTFVREVTAHYSAPRKALARITDPAAAAAFCRRLLCDNAREHFLALFLDSRSCVVAYQVISIGSADQSLVHPREVFQPAILAGSTALIVAHNHPSGDVAPSKEDAQVTRRLKEAGQLLGITLLDHVVFSGRSYHSFAQAGQL